MAVLDTPHTAEADRYERTEYRRAGRSGLDLPAFSFGLGITHFDNANRYGPVCRCWCTSPGTRSSTAARS
ncbi:hypothetical protein [Streptomyces sp. CRN 30]|uniref:hypothetical protein n=1 Tax=Streptomyces sp. CRN 30 TaxID=3075613 RepID=UPI002A80E023|nr:hypothetical protein [Streptomyces sp. CRN 30]